MKLQVFNFIFLEKREKYILTVVQVKLLSENLGHLLSLHGNVPIVLQNVHANIFELPFFCSVENLGLE